MACQPECDPLYLTEAVSSKLAAGIEHALKFEFITGTGRASVQSYYTSSYTTVTCTYCDTHGSACVYHNHTINHTIYLGQLLNSKLVDRSCKLDILHLLSVFFFLYRF